MIARRFTLALASSVFGLALLGGGVALADVAPPPDAGKIVDMASTQAKPDMTVTTPASSDSGCSMSGHGATGGSAALLGAAALGLLLVSRRRTA